MAKSQKQEEIKEEFDFSNIENAKKNFSSTKKTKTTKVEKVTIKFKVHKNLIKRFHVLRMDYAKENTKFSFSNNDMLSIAINFIVNSFTHKKILKECPADFKDAIIRPGKRKATQRTFPFTETDEIVMTINSDVADQYMNVMFSSILNDPEESIFNEYHSRTYFFYDFIDYLEENKKEFLKFQ